MLHGHRDPTGTTRYFSSLGSVSTWMPLTLVNFLHVTHPHYFRSCGRSQRRVRGPTPVLRSVARSGATAGLTLKTLRRVCGRRAAQPEEVHANMGRAFRLHLESVSRLPTSDLHALRWQFLNIRYKFQFKHGGSWSTSLPFAAKLYAFILC